MSYVAIIAEIQNVFPIEGADRIQRALVVGTTVVISKENKVGDIGIFLPCDGQLSPDFANANNLIGKYENGKKISGGFFSDSRRVKAQKFKGVKSEGFWITLDSLKFIEDKTGKQIINKLKVGDKFDQLEGIPICNKYITPETYRQRENFIKKTKKYLKTHIIGFAKHFDTENLRHNINDIPKGALLTLTFKLHGTSARSALCKIEKELSWYQKLINKFYYKYPSSYFQHVIGTRNVDLLNNTIDGYYSDPFRGQIDEKYFKDKLKKFETIYYEIVGYTTNGRPIMGSQSVKKLKEPSFIKLYGDTMEYSYGCPVGQSEAYVYRITQSNEDGDAVDLSWTQVKARCLELGVKHVPEVESQFFYDGDKEKLLKHLESLLDRPSVIDQRHIEEGIAVRVEYGFNINIYKLKSFYFLALESNAKEDESYVDTEESA